MAIFREVRTEVYCDICGEQIVAIQEKCSQYLYAAGSLGLIRGSEAIPPMAAVVPRTYQMPEK